MARRDYLIVTVNWRSRSVWRRATASSMVRQAGVPPRIASEWQQIRREMSPAGLTRKLKQMAN